MNLPPTSYILVAAFFLSSVFEAKANYREWRNQQGTTIEAMLLEQSANSIKIRKPDGSTFNIPAKNLSTADQEYLKRVGQFYDEAKQDIAQNKNIKTLPGFPIEYTSKQGHRYYVFLVTNSRPQNNPDPFATPDQINKNSKQEIKLLTPGVIAYYRSNLVEFSDAERLVTELQMVDLVKAFDTTGLWSQSEKNLAFHSNMTLEGGIESSFVVTFTEDKATLESDSEWAKIVEKKFANYIDKDPFILGTKIRKVTWKDDGTLEISKNYRLGYVNNGSKKETKRTLELELNF